MPNPWLKNNPFMSMWLTAANRMASTARGQAKRQLNAAVTKATNDNLMAPVTVTAAASPKAPPKRRR